MRILAVEDDRTLARIIQQGLEEAGHAVEVAADGQSGLELALTGDFDLIILDLMLPRLDGWSVCRELRARGRSTPILMLTARDAIEDRVRGLEIGADDYLVKPFDFRELRARVGALSRREKAQRSHVIHIADLEINTQSQQVWREGQEIMLTPREYALLEALARNAGRVLSREMVQENVWHDTDSYSNNVNVYVNYLRRKIDDGHAVKLIHTAHRKGYMLRSGEE